MRIGLYGMPTAGKSYILDKIDFLEVIAGSKLLREYDPDFDTRDEIGREKDRREVANIMKQKKDFIMDGHYAFGNEIAFTEEEGQMYDIYLYLYIAPEIIKERMSKSDKNRKYLKYDIEEWQNTEIDGLRNYCHAHKKDFFVIDNPPANESEDAMATVMFIKDIFNWYSISRFARQCADEIIKNSNSDEVILVDGDKTLCKADTSKLFMNYSTHLFDGNFYTGYQTWKQAFEFKGMSIPEVDMSIVEFNDGILNRVSPNMYIVTSGNEYIWNTLSRELGIRAFCGNQMCAETKLYITKYLQEAGKKVIAYGDSMSDYYMLKQADEGYLVSKPDGSISRSLKGKKMEGLTIV